jgi:hypothetical protein
MHEHGTGLGGTRSLLWAVLLVSLVGCAGKIERIDIAIPGPYTGPSWSGPVPGALRVAVLPFEDTRANQSNLGYRSHLWGGISIFKLSSGSITTGSAQAFADSLNRQGWQVSLVDTMAPDGADVTIIGNIQALSIDATSGWMHTDLSAKHTLMLEVRNHSDESVVHMRIHGVGTDQVFWFEPKDAQVLTTEVFEQNVQKFLGDIRIEDRAIRRR